MGLREEINKLKRFRKSLPFVRANEVSLDSKVDAFLKWYYKNMVKGHYTSVGEYHQQQELRNLIEKVAVWYELRYPDYTVAKLFNAYDQDIVNVSERMFHRNPYVNEQLDQNSEVRILDWEEFYNTKAFIDSLPVEEKYFFSKPNYKNIVYINLNAHLHLTKDGIVQEAEWFGITTNHVVNDRDLIGMHVREVLEYLKKKKVELPVDNELERMLQNIDDYMRLQSGILDCIMYRIIERGGNRIGPRRGLLFAKEFKRNIDIPMMYGVDTSDPGLRLFLNEYIKAGGKLDLVCYENYFSRDSKNTILTTTVVGYLLANRWHNGIEKYTPEETELHQRLLNALSSQVDSKKLEKEKVKQLRIERKLEKSRNNKNQF